MHNSARLKCLSIGFAMLLLGVLACNFPGYPQTPPTNTPAPINQPTLDPSAFEQTFIQGVQAATTDGKFTVTVTQEQFTAWLLVRAPEYAVSQQQEWPFKESRATFKGGQVLLYSILKQKGVPESPVQLTLTPMVDPNSEFAIKVNSGRMGILPIPDAILGRVTEIIQDAVNGQLNRIKGTYKLSTLTVNEGSLTVTGQLIR